jgi:outer membrane protein TolC
MTDVRMSAMAVIFVLVAAMCLSPCANAQTSDGEVLTLDEAISLARSHNRGLKQSGFEISKQREALSEAKTQFYPRLDSSVLAAQLLTPLNFRINAGQFGTFPGTGPIPGNDVDLHTAAHPVALVSVTATQPLTQLLRIHLFVAEQRLRVDSTQLSFDQDEQKLVDDARRAYYAVLQAQSQLESQQSMVKYLEELQQLTDRRFNQKAVLEADRLRVRADLAKTRYQIAVTQDSFEDRREFLNHLLGRDLQTVFSVETVPSTLPEEEDLPAARKVALERRAELKLAANRAKQASLETKVEKTHYIPDIGIQASYTNPVNINFLPQNIGSIGVLLTWQPWDWGQKRHNVAQKVLAEEQAALSVDDTRDQILLDVNSNFRQLREARGQLAAAEVARDADKEKLRNEQEAYSQQSILLSDLLRQQASVADAEDQYREAIFGYWRARADFQKALGEQ